MKIQFCDLCNESVPQSDLDEGRAFVRKGRVVCATCDRAMTPPVPDGSAPVVLEPSASWGAPTPGPSASPSFASFQPASAGAVAPEGAAAGAKAGSAGLWVAALAMAFTAAAVFVQNRRLEESARGIQDTRDMLARTRQDLVDQQHRLQAEVPRLIREQDSRLSSLIESARKDTEAKLAEVRDQEAKAVAEIQNTLKGMIAWRDDSGAQSQEDKRRLAELSQRVAKSEDDARLLVEKLNALEQAAKAAPPPVAATAGKNEPAWKSLLVDLTSANAGVRWEAVDGLGQARDPQAVPALLPMLKDPDVFVRMATARVLGDLKATGAVSGLLDALEDNEDAVREAAFVAMRSIVGNKDLKFDPLAPEAERAKRLKALREWWKKEEESGVGKG
jgi:hypothetical protein